MRHHYTIKPIHARKPRAESQDASRSSAARVQSIQRRRQRALKQLGR